MSRGPERRLAPLAAPLILLVRCYQRWVSPGLPPRCRFYPSCSEYAVEALRLHGVVKGIALAGWRLLRCAPWHPGGVDPVPPHRSRVAGPGVDDHVDDRADATANEERAPC